MPASSAPRTGRLSCPNPLGYGRRWKCSPVNTEFIPPFLLRNGSSLGSNGEKGREGRGRGKFREPLSPPPLLLVYTRNSRSKSSRPRFNNGVECTCERISTIEIK